MHLVCVVKQIGRLVRCAYKLPFFAGLVYAASGGVHKARENSARIGRSSHLNPIIAPWLPAAPLSLRLKAALRSPSGTAARARACRRTKNSAP